MWMFSNIIEYQNLYGMLQEMLIDYEVMDNEYE